MKNGSHAGLLKSLLYFTVYTFNHSTLLHFKIRMKGTRQRKTYKSASVMLAKLFSPTLLLLNGIKAYAV